MSRRGSFLGGNHSRISWLINNAGVARYFLERDHSRNCALQLVLFLQKDVLTYFNQLSCAKRMSKGENPSLKLLAG